MLYAAPHWLETLEKAVSVSVRITEPKPNRNSFGFGIGIGRSLVVGLICYCKNSRYVLNLKGFMLLHFKRNILPLSFAIILSYEWLQVQREQKYVCFLREMHESFIPFDLFAFVWGYSKQTHKNSFKNSSNTFKICVQSTIVACNKFVT